MGCSLARNVVAKSFRMGDNVRSYGGFDRGKMCARIGGGRTRRPRAKLHEKSNPEFRIQYPESDGRRMGNGFEQEGTFTAETPRRRAKRGLETVCRIWCWEAGRRRVGSGKRWEERWQRARVSRLFAPFPGISHLFPLKFLFA